jgi:diaminopropionate ammonia-lyase
LLAAADDDARRHLRLGADSVVIVVGTEGATDPDLYRTSVGRSAQEVSAAGAFK